MTLARLWRIGRQRFRSLAAKDRADAELDRELAFHLEQLARENQEAGMPPEEARTAARRVLGNVALLEEQCRDHRRVNWLHDAWRDVRYGWRMLLRHPGFTAVAILSLALGMGSNAAVLEVMCHALLDKLPFRDAERLVVIRTYPLASPQQNNNATLPQYIAWRDHAAGFQEMAASLPQQRDFGAQDGFPVERIPGQAVTHELFALLGAEPMLGRGFSADEDRIGQASRVIVLSYGLWQRRFGADPAIVGKAVVINGAANTIIGVMPEHFRYPLDETEYWVPFTPLPVQLRGTANYFTVTARLKPGVSMAQAQAGIEAITAQRAAEFPQTEAHLGIRVISLREAQMGWARRPLLILEAAVALVLLIACANVAGLLLAGGAARAPELAMRAALGAGHARIARQLLTEGFLLSGLGGALAIPVAWAAARAVLTLTPPPGGLHLLESNLDLRLLAWIAALALGSALLFGIVPALASARMEWPHRITAQRGRQRLLTTLVTAQIALALMALTGSGLLMKSFLRLAGRELNFQPDGLLAFEIRLPVERYLHVSGTYGGYPYASIDPPPARVMQRLLDRLRQLPGATSAAGISYPVLDSLVLPDLELRLDGAERSQDRPGLTAAYFLVTPNLFATLQTPLVRGRDFDDRDTASAPWTVIVNETAAKRFWPGESPLGKRLKLDIVPDEQPREVIGVVPDIPVLRRQTEPRPVLYASYLQQPSRYRGPWFNVFGQMTFLLRAPGDPMALLDPARQAVKQVEPAVPISRIERLGRAGGSVRGFGNYAFVVGLFAVVALALAAIGIYGVTAYAVSRRTREIGVRIALGASAYRVAKLVARQACLSIAAGLALGLAGSLGVTRLVSSQLWGVDPFDPATFATVVALLALAAVSACSIPGKRAVQIDPTIALRSE